MASAEQLAFLQTLQPEERSLVAGIADLRRPSIFDRKRGREDAKVHAGAVSAWEPRARQVAAATDTSAPAPAGALPPTGTTSNDNFYSTSHVPAAPADAGARAAKAPKQIKSVTGRTFTSRFRGVHQTFPTKRWEAQFRRGGKPTSLGCFDHEEEAARAYDRMMIWCHLHKEFSCKHGITNYDMKDYESDYDWLMSVSQEDLIESLRSDGRRQAATRQLRNKQQNAYGMPASHFDERQKALHRNLASTSWEPMPSLAGGALQKLKHSDVHIGALDAAESARGSHLVPSAMMAMETVPLPVAREAGH